MGWVQGKASNACPSFCCTQSVVAAEERSILRELRKMKSFHRPEQQRRGLLGLLKSLNDCKANGVLQSEWQLEWLACGALDVLVRIAAQGTTDLDSPQMSLLCAAASSLLHNLPETSPYFRDFFDSLWDEIRKGGESLGGMYNLFLTLLDMPSFRKAAVHMGFMNLLLVRYQTFVPPYSARQGTPVEEIDENETLIDDLFTGSPEKTDCVLETQFFDSTHHLNSSTVPSLKLGWVNSGREDRQNNTFGPAHNQEHSFGAGYPCLEVYLKKGKPEELNSKKSHNQEKTLDLSASSHNVGHGSIVPDKAFAHHHHDPGKENLPYMGHSCVNPANGHSMQATTTGKTSPEMYPFGDPRHFWGVTNRGWVSERQTWEENEKCAILEAFLLLSQDNCFNADGAVVNPIDTVLGEMMSLCAKRWLHGKEGTEMVMRLGFSVVSEYLVTVPTPTAIGERGELIRYSIDRRNLKHPIIQMIRDQLEALVSIRRSGDSAFDTAASYFDLLRSYFSCTPHQSIQATCVRSLHNTLQQIESWFLSTGKTEYWTLSLCSSFSSLLRLYAVVFTFEESACKLEGRLLRWLSDDQWLALVEGYMDRVLDESWVDIQHAQRREWHLSFWDALTSVSMALSSNHCSETLSTGAGPDGLGHPLHFYMGNPITQWDFLIKPHEGLVCKVLKNADGGDVSNGVDKCLHAKVLRFLSACMAIPGNNLVNDHRISSFYMQLHLSRFIRVYTKQHSNIHEQELCSLHLRVVGAMLEHRQNHLLYLLQRFRFPEFLVAQIKQEALENEPIQSRTVDKDLPIPADPFLEVPILPNPSTTSELEFGEEPLKMHFKKAAAGEEENLSLEEMEKMVSSSTSCQQVQRVAQSPCTPTAITKPDSPQFQSKSTQSGLAGVSCNDSERKLQSRTDELAETTTSSQSPGNQREVVLVDQACPWPEGVPITGDLDKDMQNLDNYEQAVHRASVDDQDQYEVDFEFSSDSDDGLPLPSPRIRPSVVPPLVLMRSSSSSSCQCASSNKGAHQRKSVTHVKDSFGKLMIDEATKSKKSAGPLEDGSDAAPGSHWSLSLCSPRVLIWASTEVHLVVIEVLIDVLLLVESVHGTLRDREDELGWVGQLSGTLFYHVNHVRFRSLLPGLEKRFMGKGKDAKRMLRLFLRHKFDAALYCSTERIHHGQRAQVHRCAMKAAGEGIPNTTAVKVMDFPTDPDLHVCLLDLFSEVSVMEKLKGEEEFCQLHDFGPTEDSIFLVMKDYECSLQDWRTAFPSDCPSAIRLFLGIFREILLAVDKLHNHSVVHFDLKCSNILLQRLEGAADSEFWVPETEEQAFNIVLSDFGEARCYEGKESDATVRNRGTEFFKSPEMLCIADGPDEGYNRLQRNGAGAPSDVWGLGCLLFELITGTVLQYDKIWLRFYTRVTRETLPVLDDARIQLLDPCYRPTIVSLLEFILVRNQRLRPSISAVMHRVDQILAGDLLPSYKAPTRVQPSSTCLLSNWTGTTDPFADFEFGGGTWDITEHVSICYEGDIFQSVQSCFAMQENVAAMVFLGCCDRTRSAQEEKSVVGLCARLAIDGFATTEESIGKQGVVHDFLAVLKESGRRRNHGKVIVCGWKGCKLKLLLELAARILWEHHGLTRFETWLAIRQSSKTRDFGRGGE